MKRKVKRKKTISSEPITRVVLQEELKKFATKGDLKSFATKDDFSDFKIEIFTELSKAELKALDREQAYHSDVMTKFDKIMKKLETKEQEDEIGNFQMKERLENHEEKIKILESAQKS